jgi:hypothetical protein
MNPTATYVSVNIGTSHFGDWSIDLHRVRTENGIHFDATVWQHGNAIAYQGNFQTEQAARKWASKWIYENSKLYQN